MPTRFFRWLGSIDPSFRRLPRTVSGRSLPAYPAPFHSPGRPAGLPLAGVRHCLQAAVLLQQHHGLLVKRLAVGALGGGFLQPGFVDLVGGLLPAHIFRRRSPSAAPPRAGNCRADRRCPSMHKEWVLAVPACGASIETAHFGRAAVWLIRNVGTISYLNLLWPSPVPDEPQAT